MEALFLQIVNMSITASWLIVAVILLRLVMGKAPKGLRYVLWALVGIRLVCPISLESAFSMIPSVDIVTEQGLNMDIPEVNTGIEIVDKVIYPMISAPDENAAVENATPNNTVQNNSTQNNSVSNNQTSDIPQAQQKNPMSTVSYIWVGGMIALLVYAMISYSRLRHTIKASIQREDNLWICDEIQSPFILGLIRPQIYMPSYIEESHFPYIVAHEREHIRYKDHWWKPLGFILLAIHWFNPLVWAAYILMCRDIELACDERVIRTMEVEEKKQYSKSLLLCSNPRHFISACPVAFGEVGVKERIKKIVDYRKPSVWIAGIGIVLCIIVAVGFMTNPKEELKDVAKIELRSPRFPDGIEITDKEKISRIVDGINDLTLVPVGPNLPSGGWSYEIHMYDEKGKEIDSFEILGDNRVEETYLVYMTINGTFDTEFFDECLVQASFELQEPEQDDEEKEQGALSESELEWFATKFFNNDENEITNMLLASEYSSAKYINLGYLFYGGYNDSNVSEEEKQMLARKDAYAQGYVYALDVSKVTRQDMEAVLQRYLGMSLEETALVNLNKLYYLEEYDAYYNISGDTKWSRYAFEKGWKKEDDTIVLEYYDALNGDSTQLYQVTLKSIQGNYVVVSNVSLNGANQNAGENSQNMISTEQ